MGRSALRKEDLQNAARRGRQDPVWWIENVLRVKLHPHQKDLINRTYFHPTKRKHAWITCHSVAKTHSLSGYCLHHLFNKPFSKVITSAPTATQLEQVLWAEMRGMLRKCKLDLGGTLLPRAPELTITPEWYMIGLNANVPEAFQGRKSPHLLIVIDEASGVKDFVFEALLGNLASGEVTIILASNPTRATGQVARCCQPGGLEVWHVERVDAFDTPNFAGLKSEFDDPKTKLDRKIQMLREAEDRVVAGESGTVTYLARPGWAADILQEFGEDSDVWRVRVRGEFPKGDPNQLITLGDHTDAVARWLDINAMDEYTSSLACSKGLMFPWWKFRHLLPDKVTGGLDVARLGDCNSVLSAQARLAMMPQIVYPPSKTVNLSGLAAADIETFGIHQTNVDEPGVGGGPVDELGCYVAGIVPFNGGARAFNPKRFVNLRSEQFWNLRLLYQRGLPAIPPGDRLTGQITALRYGFMPTGERLVEGKPEMRARGIHYMDEADSEMMAFAQVPGAEAVVTGANVVGLQYLADDDEED